MQTHPNPLKHLSHILSQHLLLAQHKKMRCLSFLASINEMISHASLSSLAACIFLSCKQTIVPFHCNFLCISNGESQGPALSCEITWGQSFRGSQIKAKSQVALSEGSYCKWKSTPKNTNSLHSCTVFVFMTWVQMRRIISVILSDFFQNSGVSRWV